MVQNKKQVSVSGAMLLTSVLLNAIVLEANYLLTCKAV